MTKARKSDNNHTQPFDFDGRGKAGRENETGDSGGLFFGMINDQINRVTMPKIDQVASAKFHPPKNVNKGTVKPAAAAAPIVKEVV